MIFYFSGTGNSAYVANKIARKTNDKLYSINDALKKGEVFDCSLNVLSGDKEAQDAADGTENSACGNEHYYVFVVPTYSWRIPNVVENWIRTSNFTGKIRTYFVLTCGDGIGNASPYAEKLCRDKNLIYMGCGQVVMPENYIALFNAPDEKEAREIIRKSMPKIEELTSHIKSGEPFAKEPVGMIGKIESSFVHSVFYAAIVKDKKFKADDGCTGCGGCVVQCPINNIELKNGRPVWKGNCTHCMACITCCPEEAIEYGRKSVGQPRYRCPDME